MSLIRTIFPYILFFLLAILCACGGGEENSGESGPEPGENNRVLRLFQKPFSGEYNNGWPLDHDLPFGVFNKDKDEGSDHVLTWRGEILVLNWGNGKYHNGYDWILPENTPLLAAAEGRVIFAGHEQPFTCGSRGQAAALIITIEHSTSEGEIFQSQYVHLNRIDVETGDYVSAGQQIGLSGNTGCSSGPHLHFSVYRVSESGERIIIDPFGWEGDFPDPWEEHPEGTQSLWLWKKGQAPEGDYSF